MKIIIFIFLMFLSINAFSKTVIDDPDSLIKYNVDSIMALEYAHLDIDALKEADWQKVSSSILWNTYYEDRGYDAPDSLFESWRSLNENSIENTWKEVKPDLGYKPNFLNEKRIQRIIYNGGMWIEYEALIGGTWWSGFLLHCEH